MNRLFYLAILKSQNLKVTELKAEFFPPKEDVVLQNESPTDFYIMQLTNLMTGCCINCWRWVQIQMK